MDNLTTRATIDRETQADDQQAADPSAATAAWAFLGGVAAAAVLWTVANAAARSTIEGPGWSLSGNGALGVLAAGAVVVLGGGWTLVAVQFTRRIVVVAAAVLAALAVGLVWAFPFLFSGPTAALSSGVAPALLAALAGAALARLADVWGKVPASVLIADLVLIIASLVVPGLLQVVGWLLLPMLLTLPLVTTAGRSGSRRWLLTACVALPIGLVAGLIGLSTAFGLG